MGVDQRTKRLVTQRHLDAMAELPRETGRTRRDPRFGFILHEVIRRDGKRVWVSVPDDYEQDKCND